MPHPCRHRTLTMAVPNQDPPTFSVPTDAAPIDELLEYLSCSKDPEVDEVIVNGMELMFKSQRAREVVGATLTRLGEDLNLPPLLKGEEGDKQFSKLTHSMELLMAMGFLTGTAIGFAAGLEFESDEDDDPDGFSQEGPVFGVDY